MSDDDRERLRPAPRSSPEPVVRTPDEGGDGGNAREATFEAEHSLADLRAAMAARKLEITQAAKRLGVEAHELIPAAPWVIVGAVEGRAFYMRERWEQYAIVIASDDEPAVQPWGRPEARAITLRTGHADDLYIGTPPDRGRAVDFIVEVIREYLRRASCAHPHRAGDRYCPACGDLAR